MSNRSLSMIHIATLGKTVGLKGDMKLHVQSDFPEQFVKGAVFFINKNETITLSEINLEKGLVKIKGYDTPESAKKLTNAKLYTTLEKTKEDIHLQEGEYFWFDIIGCELYEGSRYLGKVQEVERITLTDYLAVGTDQKLVEEGFAKNFLVPYHKNFIVSVDIDKKRIDVTGAFDILEAS
ncbi:MAG: ribosome maturation factor RimM [Sulfurimonadaceae bacterium]